MHYLTEFYKTYLFRSLSQGDNRYQMNSYQPYVFRPNFMKNTDGERKHSSRKVIDWTGACVQTLLSRRFKRSFKASV